MGIKLSKKVIERLANYAKTVNAKSQLSMQNQYAKFKMYTNVPKDLKEFARLKKERNQVLTEILFDDPSLYTQRKGKVIEDYDNKVGDLFEKYVEGYLLLKSIKPKSLEDQKIVERYVNEIQELFEDSFDTSYSKKLMNGIVTSSFNGIPTVDDNVFVDEPETISPEEFSGKVEYEQYLVGENEASFIDNTIDEIKNSTSYNQAYKDQLIDLYNMAKKESNKLQDPSFSSDVKGDSKFEIETNLKIKKNAFILENSFKQVLKERDELAKELALKTDDLSKINTKYIEYKTNISKKSNELMTNIHRVIREKSEMNFDDLVLRSEAIHQHSINEYESRNRFLNAMYESEKKRLERLYEESNLKVEEFRKQIKEADKERIELTSKSFMDDNEREIKENKLNAYNDFIDSYYVNIKGNLETANYIKKYGPITDYSKNAEVEKLVKKGSKEIKAESSDRQDEVEQNVESIYDLDKKAIKKIKNAFDQFKKYEEDFLNNEEELESKISLAAAKTLETKVDKNKEEEKIKEYYDGLVKKSKVLQEEEQEKEHIVISDNEINTDIVIENKKEEKAERKENDKKKINFHTQDALINEHGMNYLDIKSKYAKEKSNHSNIFDYISSKEQYYQEQLENAKGREDQFKARENLRNAKIGMYVLAREEHAKKKWGFRFISRIVDSYKIGKLRDKYVKEGVSNKEMMEDILDSFKKHNYLKEHEVEFEKTQQLNINEADINRNEIEVDLNKVNQPVLEKVDDLSLEK